MARNPTTFETVRVAAIQATPVILNAEASVDKAVALLHAAADDGARLAVLPETFVSLYALYRQGPQIWVAPTADDGDGWLASMRHIAIESGAFVVSVPQYIPRSAFPDDFPAELPEREVYGNGGAAIISPKAGEVIA